MTQSQTQSHELRIVDESDSHEIGDEPTLPTAYEDAEEVDLSAYASYSFPKFISAVLEAVGKDFDGSEVRLVDEIDDPDDVHFGLLLAAPDESLLFVGSDPTAKDSIPWFAFTIERHEPIPAPDTAQDALDLLKPPQVQDIEHEDDWLPNRHGEWWLYPTNCVPAGTVFTPGVQSTPYGPSPLGNHVPREYAFTVTDRAFMDTFHEAVSAPSSLATPEEAIEWTARQIQKPHVDDHPNWADIRSFGGDIIVRGSVRHRDNDHFVENLGDIWHKAATHDIEVYTGDEVATNVHIDYHGR
jgi:hypothetical protein